jgi:hypothetical protein
MKLDCCCMYLNLFVLSRLGKLRVNLPRREANSMARFTGARGSGTLFHLFSRLNFNL